MTTQPARSRVTLTDISSRAWEHPADRGALVALRRLKGFDTVLKAMSGLFNERAVRLVYLGSAIRVDERQFASLHRLLGEVAQTLDAPELPELYVTANPVPGALTIGMNKPFIVLNSGLVDLLDTEGLRFVLAHELGHAISGHAVYQTLLQRLIQLSGVLSAVPIGGLAFRAIMAALYEWSRKAELSADRAGLLATQDPATAFRVHMQLASGGHLDDLDATSFLAQGQEYADAGDLRDSVLKLLLIENRSHPFAVVRASELRRWVDSGEYTGVLSGAYPRRTDDDSADVTDAARDAARSYSEAFEQSQDAMGKVVHDVAGLVGSAKLWLDDKLRRGGNPASVAELFARLPIGWTVVEHEGWRYGVTRSVQVGGRSQKVYAEELGGADVISANLYLPGDGEERFRPCEMPAAKVLAFLRGWRAVGPA